MNVGLKNSLSVFLLLCFMSSILALPGYAITEVALEEADSHEHLFSKVVNVKSGDTLSLLDCVSIAFNNSPRIKRAKYELDVAKSNVGIARAAYFPVINAGIGFYNENNSNKRYYDGYYRQLPNVGVSINKMVWDFGKTTSYIKMEKFYQLGAEYEFMDSLCETLFDIKRKYYNVLAQKANFAIAKNSVELNEKFLAVAEEFAKIDETKAPGVTNAKTKLKEAEMKYLDAKYAYQDSIIDLNNAMYLPNQIDFDIQNTKTFDYSNEYISYKKVKSFEPEKLPFTNEEALEIAYENSPDLKVLESTKDAMAQSLTYIRRTYFPELSANVGYGFNATNNQGSDNQLQVGVQLNSAVNLMELKHSIRGADAQLNIADNEIKLFKQDLFYIVKHALISLDKTERKVPVAQKRVEHTGEHMRVAFEAYKTDEIDYTAMQDAIDWYTNAMYEFINAVYYYNIALIDVEQAMHCHIIDIHHKSEHAMKEHSKELLNAINKWMNCDEKEKHKSKKKFMSFHL